MNHLHAYNLVAFLAVLIAIVILALAGKATDLAIMTGLVGILGSFRPWGVQSPVDGAKVEIDQPPGKAIPVNEQEKSNAPTDLMS